MTVSDNLEKNVKQFKTNDVHLNIGEVIFYYEDIMCRMKQEFVRSNFEDSSFEKYIDKINKNVLFLSLQ